MYKISVETVFSAAHHLREYEGDCENVHGHNWKVRVTARYDVLPENGMAIDFRDLKSETENILAALDHKDINSLPYFEKINPTSENIAKYIFDQIKSREIPVEKIEVFETDSYIACYSED
ncbi:6-carboxytetrahydropterin synthase QueD [Elusimicrobiota bacterium]